MPQVCSGSTCRSSFLTVDVIPIVRDERTEDREIKSLLQGVFSEAVESLHTQICLTQRMSLPTRPPSLVDLMRLHGNIKLLILPS